MQASHNHPLILCIYEAKSLAKKCKHPFLGMKGPSRGGRGWWKRCCHLPTWIYRPPLSMCPAVEIFSSTLPMANGTEGPFPKQQQAITTPLFAKKLKFWNCPWIAAVKTKPISRHRYHKKRVLIYIYSSLYHGNCRK